MKISSKYWFTYLFLFSTLSLQAKPFVEAESHGGGQLGNQLFIVATAYAFAWDHDIDVYLPELTFRYPYHSQQNIPLNLEHLFFRCNLSKPPRPALRVWNQPKFNYHKIPFSPDMKIQGYFQSEKYFAHHRNRLLELFAPRADDWKYIQTKYKWILEHPCTVSVHLRKYWDEPDGNTPQYGKDYLRKAMKLFPKNSLFVLFSNDHNFARDNIPEEMASRVVHIENEPHYIDLFLQSACKDNIITNSSFGWWGAWLNQNPKKVVVAPSEWVGPKSGLDTCDLLPKNWIQIDAKWGALKDPKSFQ